MLGGGSFGTGPNFTTLDRDATTPLLQALGNNGIGYATFAQVVNQKTVRVVPVDGATPDVVEAEAHGAELLYAGLGDVIICSVKSVRGG